ncbi:MAG TPA: hypothetical protein VKG38_15780 [Solirubrobacteraceae bacterium]|nr:hypothetical protein [Solirubrobacteraceae bacterium]HME71145.1 hypothetical protein [Myxococcota bacterium]
MTLRSTTVVRDSRVFRGGKFTLTLGLNGHWTDPETGRQHVAAYLLAAVLADHAGDAEQAAAWLGDAVAMAGDVPTKAGPWLRGLAQEVAKANAQREAELAAMSPDARERAIDEWAKNLAAEAADWND